MIHVVVPRGQLLTSNQRLHWREKAARTKALRLSAFLAARGTPAKTARQHCTVTVSWPNARRRDVHNLMPTVKACIDGIVDAKVLPDDSDRWLVGPDLRVSDERCDPHYGCALAFEFAAVTA